jgi:hypothetical protein
LPDLPFLSGDARGGEQLGPAHRRERDQDGPERQRVAGKTQGEADGRGDQPAQRGAEDASQVHRHRVERHGVREIVRRHHLGYEGLPRWVVKHVDEAERQGQQVDDPQPDGAGRDQDGIGSREQPGQGLGEVEHPLLVHPVREHPADRAEQEHRQEPGRRRQAELGAAAGEVQHDERLGHGLHPRPGHRDQLPEEEEPVVALQER